MPENVNEDLIEATIRRVAQSKAKGESLAEAGDAPQENPNEDLIEATIRRVAQSKAKGEELAETGGEPPENENEDLIEATIRRVAQSKAKGEELAGASEETEDIATSDGLKPVLPVDESIAPEFGPRDKSDADEDLIEATIRRVAEQKAARDSGEVEPEPAPEWTPEPEAPQEAPKRLRDLWDQAPNAAPIGAPMKLARREPSHEAPQPIERAPFPAAPAPATATADTALLQAVLQRLDELMPLLERIAAGAQPAPFAPSPSSAPIDDDWDESPQISRLPSAAPRPAIFRDPSPQTATAEVLEPVVAEQVIDTRPLPKPLPPIHAEPRRGLDLLPRTYRLTVEDKRRGVDLVPLHRALLGMDGVRDMSLLSYNNGVAIVSIETVSDLPSETLEHAVSRAMARNARVEVHNEFTMVVKLGED